MAITHVKQRNSLTKSEFKLFNDSLPRTAKTLTRARVNSALKRTQDLIRKYQKMSRAKGTSDKKIAVLEYRLKTLHTIRTRYAHSLDRLDKREMAKMRPAKVKQKRALTEQPKMHVNLQDSPRNSYMYKGKPKQYDQDTKVYRQLASPARETSKRIGGYIKARDRKGQVARDKVTGSKER